MMVKTVKRVVRLDLHLDPAFDTRFGGEPGIELAVCALAGPEEAIRTAFSKAHVYQVSAAKDELPRRWWVSDHLLAEFPGLLCVSSGGAGYDTVDVAACTRAGVAVLNQAGGNATSVAEHTLGMLLALSHRMVESDRRLRRERGFSREDLMGREAAGKVLGLVGIGEVGRRMARLAAAFGIEVLAIDPKLDDAEIARRGAKPVSLDELLAGSDFVSLHCPRTPDTLGMFDAGAFGRMKRGALFITTARGGIHSEPALLAALRSGHLGGAGLDVWEPEPPAMDHGLLALDNVIATFHTAGVTHEARRAIAAMSAEQIVGFLAGERPPRLVNPEVWPACAERLAAT